MKILPLQPDSKTQSTINSVKQDDERLKRSHLAVKTGKEFETAFIAQMLQFSGLAKALTMGGGEAANSFTHFYLQTLAEDVVAQGGFGISQQITDYIIDKEENHGELGSI